MTKIVSGSLALQNDKEETLQEYIMRKQDEFLWLLESAAKHQKIDEVTYRRMLLETCEAETWDEVFDHFKRAFDKAAEAVHTFQRGKLLQRIVSGAEFIEGLPKDDPKYQPALNKYDGLCDELKAMDRVEGMA